MNNDIIQLIEKDYEDSVEKFIMNNKEKTLYNVFGIDSLLYKSINIEDMNFSIRTLNSIKLYLNPPLLNYENRTIFLNEILNLKISEIIKIRNLGKKGFVELIDKTYELIKKVQV